jgi:hypothetical protein
MMSRPEFFRYKKAVDTNCPKRDELILAILSGLLTDTGSYGGEGWQDKLVKHAVSTADKVIMEAKQ